MSSNANPAWTPSLAKVTTGSPVFVHGSTCFDSGITPSSGNPRSSCMSSIDTDSSLCTRSASNRLMRRDILTGLHSFGPSSARRDLLLWARGRNTGNTIVRPIRTSATIKNEPFGGFSLRQLRTYQMNPTILSASRSELTSGFVTMTASSQNNMA